MLSKPYIYGALFKFEGQVGTFNYQDGPTYRCLYPEAPAPGEVPACGEAGVLGVLPGIIGTWQATEAIKVITGVGEVLSGKLLIMNLLTNNIDLIRFKAAPENKQVKDLPFDADSCFLESGEIDYKTLNSLLDAEAIQLIDVREEYEFDRFNIGGVNIPFSEFDEKLSSVEADVKTVVVCATGSRSLKALEILKNKLPQLEVYHLKGGLQAGV
jgi:adenylyltransferase/sulfurtransferase